MKYEINRPPFYKRVFATPELRFIISIMLLIIVVVALASRSMQLICAFLVLPSVAFLIFFIIAFAKQYRYVKSIDVGEKLIIEIFKKDKPYKTYNLSYEEIRVDFYTLFIGKRPYSSYSEEYKVLLVQYLDGTRIISQDAKNGWSQSDLKKIYEQILLKKEQNSGDPATAAT